MSGEDGSLKPMTVGLDSCLSKNNSEAIFIFPKNALDLAPNRQSRFLQAVESWGN